MNAPLYAARTAALYAGNPLCGACGSPTRRMFEKGKGKNAKAQRSKWWVCQRGHKIMRKRGQV